MTGEVAALGPLRPALPRSVPQRPPWGLVPDPAPDPPPHPRGPAEGKGQVPTPLLLEPGHLGLELQLQAPLQVPQLGLLLPAQVPHLRLAAPLQLGLLPLQLLTLGGVESWGGQDSARSQTRQDAPRASRLQPPRCNIKVCAEGPGPDPLPSAELHGL